MIFIVRRRRQDRENYQWCTNRKMLGGRNEYGVPRFALSDSQINQGYGICPWNDKMLLKGRLNLRHTVGKFNQLVKDNRETFYKYFQKYLFPGSVNIRVDEPKDLQEKLDMGVPPAHFVIPRNELINIPSYLGNGQTWECKFYCEKFPEPIDCWIFRRINSKVPKGIIELVSEHELVKPYSLVDGDEVLIEIFE